MKYFVLVMLLLTSPALAENWDEGEPDDIECSVAIGGYNVTYTYNSRHPPKVMPVEDMMCFTRDVEAMGLFNRTQRKLIKKYWEGIEQ